MLAALIEGRMSPEGMAHLAKGSLKKKHEELCESLTGRLRPQHVLLLTQMPGHIGFLDKAVETCDGAIEEAVRPFSMRSCSWMESPGWIIVLPKRSLPR